MDNFYKEQSAFIPSVNEFTPGITIRKLILKQNICKMSNDWYITVIAIKI